MLTLIIFYLNILSYSTDSYLANPQVSIKMEIPMEIVAGEDFQVTLSIEKGNLRSFSRFSQDLPKGLTATGLNTANADFSFDEQRVRFIWLKLPAEPGLKISYLVKTNERLKGSFNLDGEFSYIDGNERKNIIVSGEHKITIKPNPAISENQLVDINDFNKGLLNFQPANKASSTETKVETASQSPMKLQSVEKKSTTVTSSPSSNTALSQINAPRLKPAEKPHLLKSENGIYFRVQLAVGKKAIDISSYFRDKNINDEVKLEFIDGWRKYTTGPFKNYEQARAYMFKINKIAGMEDAFVVAYNNGVRIDILEAIKKSDNQ